MASQIIAENVALTQYVPVTDDAGRHFLIPRSTYEHDIGRGVTSYPTTMHLKPAEPPKPWLTVTDAAKAHLDDIDGMTLETAKMRVSRAASRQHFDSRGEGRERRIDPLGFAAWRLRERERVLDELDQEKGD